MKEFGKFVIVMLFTTLIVFATASASIINQKASGDIPSTENIIGPDYYGYYCIQSTDSLLFAPEFNWIEISAFGTTIPFVNDDQNLGPFNIGFDFVFYGNTFTTFRACTNGFVSFTSTVNNWTNQPIPTAAEPNNLLAAYWDDFYPDASSHVYYYTNNSDSLVVEYYNMPKLTDNGRCTFEIILTHDNIIYQYLTLDGAADSHTIGIENSDGTAGLEYIYNTSSTETGTAVMFTRGKYDILVVAADAADSLYFQLARMPEFGRMVYFDARNGTPSLPLLQNYDAAIVWSNSTFDNPAAMGDVLADYLDLGGAVVLTNFCFYGGWAIQGRITNYTPFAPGTSISQRNLGDRESGHYLLNGVDSLSEHYSINITLQNSPLLVASYTDGTPLAAYNTNKNLVALNIYVGVDRNSTGNATELVRNSLMFAIMGTKADVLVLAADNGLAIPARELKRFSDIDGVHIYDSRYSSPSLAMLNQYDAVVAWTNYAALEPQVLGNRLADYVDGGGGVVLPLFSFAGSYIIQGRIMDSYCPFANGVVRYENHSLGQYNPSSPLMQDVSNITDYFTGAVSMRNGGVSVASWDDSTPFVAYNPVNGMVALNCYNGYYRHITDDKTILVHNAVNFVRGYSGIPEGGQLPSQIALSQNYPNPFNPATSIAFDLPTKSKVTITVFNLLGQIIATLADGEYAAGHHVVNFNAEALGSGVYFYRLQTDQQIQTKKMVVLK